METTKCNFLVLAQKIIKMWEQLTEELITHKTIFPKENTQAT